MMPQVLAGRHAFITGGGTGIGAAVARMHLAHWQRMLDVNLTGVFLSVRAALPDVTGHPSGRIVLIASTAGLKGYPYVAADCAARHGVIGLARARRRGIKEGAGAIGRRSASGDVSP
jgi:NAD(P)-dependent dehydrogenase (short-subunit alcohol dehydrogenase family)